MAKRTKKTAVQDNVVEDIVRAGQLLSESNNKLLAKIASYEDEIELLKEEVKALKSHTRKKRVDELTKDNNQLRTLTQKLQSSEKKYKELAQELQNSYSTTKDHSNVMQKELDLLKKQIEDKEETLLVQQKALSARKNESQMIAQVNKKLREKSTHTQKNADSISDLVTARSIEIRRLRRLCQKYTEEIHELLQKERAYKEKLVSFQEHSMKERRTTILMAQKIEHLKEQLKSITEKSRETHSHKKDMEEMLTNKHRELEKHLVNIKILTEDAAEKERVIARLNQALKTRKEEAHIIADINKRIVQKDKELSTNQRRIQELMMVKDEQSHNYKLIAEELKVKLEHSRESHVNAHKEFEKVVSQLNTSNENVRLLEAEKRKMTQTLVHATREHEKQKQEIEGFKHQIKKLFGINKEMEGKTLRFSDYLENVRRLLYKKQSIWDQKEADYKEEIETIKQEAEDKIKHVLKEETDTVISLKTALVRLKEELKEKEEKLIKRDIQERDMVLEITKHLKGRYDQDGSDIKVTGVPLGSTQGVPDEVTRALVEKERQINKDLLELQLLKRQSEGRILGELEDHIIVGEERVELPQEPVHIERPQHVQRARPQPQQHPVQRPQPTPRQQPIRRSQPQARPQQIKKQVPVQSPQNTHHETLRQNRERYAPQTKKPQETINLRKYYQENAGEDAKTILSELEHQGEGEKPTSEVQFIEGQPQKKRKEEDFGSQMGLDEPAIDLGISYSKSNPLVSMVDIGLQQGEDIDTIRDSLIKTGYDAKEVEKVISIFKRGKLGSL